MTLSSTNCAKKRSKGTYKDGLIQFHMRESISWT